MKQIFTIGYQRLSPQRLLRIAERLSAIVIDCRYKPVSRIPGWSRTQLEASLAPRYMWKGNVLGGMGHTKPEGIAWLKERPNNLILLCLEHAPGDCHRHHDICAPHFPDAIHIFEDELVKACDLQASIVKDSEYDIQGSLRDLLAA